MAGQFIMPQQGDKFVKPVIDTVVVAGIPASILDWPHWSGLYSILGIVWLLFRIYETAVFQRIKNKIKGILFDETSS